MEDEFFEEYDELASFVENSDYLQFKRNLQRWFDHIKASEFTNVVSFLNFLLKKAEELPDDVRLQML